MTSVVIQMVTIKRYPLLYHVLNVFLSQNIPASPKISLSLFHPLCWLRRALLQKVGAHETTTTVLEGIITMERITFLVTR
jgi:hypothetical protein